jgi:hypothetical protein
MRCAISPSLAPALRAVRIASSNAKLRSHVAEAGREELIELRRRDRHRVVEHTDTNTRSQGS